MAWTGWGLSLRASTGPSTADQAPIKVAAPASPTSGSTSGSLDEGAIAKLVEPAVVDVNTVIGNLGDARPTGEAAGTGMLVSSSGEVLTNNHVVEGATSIRVTLAGSSTSYAATVLGVDPAADVALLQIQGVAGLPIVTFADPSSLAVGEHVIAIGNALGRGGTPEVTGGTITALDRSITVNIDFGGTESLSGMIEMSTLIKPGDSGGPLVNAEGQVVGMITAAQPQGARRLGSDIAFAVPVGAAVAVVDDIRAGQAGTDIILGQPGYLGIEAGTLTSGAATRLGLNVGSGVLVVSVVPGGPAAAAGIPQNAVIIAIDGQSVTSIDKLGHAIHSHGPGEQIRVTWVDTNGTHTASVRLVAGPAV